jgi:hypothetical protein
MISPPGHSHIRSFVAAVAVAIPAMVTGAGLIASPAQATFTLTLLEEGTSVVATGMGRIDKTDLNMPGSVGQFDPQIDPSGDSIIAGAGFSSETDTFTGITGPTSFGSGSFHLASSGTGNLVGVTPNAAGTEGILVPSTYVSDSSLSDTATWNSASFTSLGVTPGTYTWTWGTGADADSFTLQIGAVPAPPIGHGLPALFAVGGLLLGAKLLERGKRSRLQFG